MKHYTQCLLDAAKKKQHTRVVYNFQLFTQVVPMSKLVDELIQKFTEYPKWMYEDDGLPIKDEATAEERAARRKSCLYSPHMEVDGDSISNNPKNDSSDPLLKTLSELAFGSFSRKSKKKITP